MGKWKTEYNYGRNYKEEWEKEFSWLTNRSGSCYCKVCKCAITTKKKSNLSLHEKTEKHKKASEAVVKSDTQFMKNFFTPSDKRDPVKIFEIKYAVGVACHSSISSVDHLTEIISKSSKGHDLGKVKLHRTKCTAILKNIVSVSLLEELISELKTTKYSLLIDESTDVAGTKHLCSCVRYFSERQSCIRTVFLALIPVTVTTGEALYEAIINYLEGINIDICNCIGFSSDGANNVCGVNNSVLSRLREKVPKIIFVKCTCHSLALCCEHAFKKLPANLDYLLSETARWFKLSSLRKEQFKDIFNVMNNDYIQPSRFITPSNTRWLVKGKCIYNVLTQWYELKAYFSVLAEKEKNYHARIIHEMICDERNFLYLTFALPVIQDFESVNAAFQATDPQPSKVFGELMQLHRSLAQRLYEDESMKTPVSMNRVKYGDKFHYELSKSRLSEKEKHSIKQRCYDFLHEAKNQLDKRISKDVDTIGNLKEFHPKKCLSQLRKSFPSISRTFAPLTYETADASRKTTLLQLQYDKLPSVDWKQEFAGDAIPTDSVTFWASVQKYENAAGVKCFAELSQMVLNAHALPLSNAYVERIFSYITSIKSKVRNRLCLGTMEAVLRIRSHLAGVENCCKDFQVTDRMLSLFNNSMYTRQSDGQPTEPSTSVGSTGEHDLEEECQDMEEAMKVAF